MAGPWAEQHRLGARGACSARMWARSSARLSGRDLEAWGGQRLQGGARAYSRMVLGPHRPPQLSQLKRPVPFKTLSPLPPQARLPMGPGPGALPARPLSLHRLCRDSSVPATRTVSPGGPVGLPAAISSHAPGRGLREDAFPRAAGTVLGHQASRPRRASGRNVARSGQDTGAFELGADPSPTQARLLPRAVAVRTA